jgi:hypothetical protein
VRLVQACDAGKVRPGDLLMWVVEDSVEARSSWREVSMSMPLPDNDVAIGLVSGEGITVKRHAQVLVAR